MSDPLSHQGEWAGPGQRTAVALAGRSGGRQRAGAGALPLVAAADSLARWRAQWRGQTGLAADAASRSRLAARLGACPGRPGGGLGLPG